MEQIQPVLHGCVFFPTFSNFLKILDNRHKSLTFSPFGVATASKAKTTVLFFFWSFNPFLMNIGIILHRVLVLYQVRWGLLNNAANYSQMISTPDGIGIITISPMDITSNQFLWKDYSSIHNNNIYMKYRILMGGAMPHQTVL